MKMHSRTSASRTRGPSQKLLSIAALLTTVALAGCGGTNLPASVKGGECRVFERPEYAIQGATQYDQDWADGNVEAGIGGCGWKRPKPRPANWTTHTVGGKTVPTPARAKPTPSKKGLVSRIKARVTTKPVDVVPPPAVEAPPPPPKPVDPLDELLGTK